VNLEFLEPIALKHCSPDANHPGLEFIDRKGCGRRRKTNANEDEEREESSKRAGFHRYTQDEDTGKPLKSQAPTLTKG